MPPKIRAPKMQKLLSPLTDIQIRNAKHHAAIGTDELPEFLKAFRRVEASMFLPTRIRMRLMLLVCVRTSELIETPWSEINLDNETWVIPWDRFWYVHETVVCGGH